jgi:hypothetical protein
MRRVPEREFTDAQINAALEALTEPDRFRAAESRVGRIAPQLQRILGHALSEGGWFGEAATTPDPDERIRAVRTLMAEDSRIAMLVGVAVGWELAIELDQP